MDFKSALRGLEKEFDSFIQEVEGFFTPGFGKYTGYGEFVDNFAVDFTPELGFVGMEESVLVKEGEVENEKVEEVEIETQEPEEIDFDDEVVFRNYVRAYRKPPVYAGWEVRRVAAHHMGYGVLGRCFPYSGIIEIRGDLYGDDFQEVLTHEIIHMQNPGASELDVRQLTRMRLSFTPRWH
jgi:hypothetical protein